MSTEILTDEKPTQSQSVAGTVSVMLRSDTVVVNYLLYENGKCVGAIVRKVMSDVVNGRLDPAVAKGLFEEHGKAPDAGLDWLAANNKPMPWEGVDEFIASMKKAAARWKSEAPTE